MTTNQLIRDMRDEADGLGSIASAVEQHLPDLADHFKRIEVQIQLWADRLEKEQAKCSST
jgi:hypothetical protein